MIRRVIQNQGTPALSSCNCLNMRCFLCFQLNRETTKDIIIEEIYKNKKVTSYSSKPPQLYQIWTYIYLRNWSVRDSGEENIESGDLAEISTLIYSPV